MTIPDQIGWYLNAMSCRCRGELHSPSPGCAGANTPESMFSKFHAYKIYFVAHKNKFVAQQIIFHCLHKLRRMQSGR